MGIGQNYCFWGKFEVFGCLKCFHQCNALPCCTSEYVSLSHDSFNQYFFFQNKGTILKILSSIVCLYNICYTQSQQSLLNSLVLRLHNCHLPIP